MGKREYLVLSQVLWRVENLEKILVFIVWFMDLLLRFMYFHLQQNKQEKLFLILCHCNICCILKDTFGRLWSTMVSYSQSDLKWAGVSIFACSTLVPLKSDKQAWTAAKLQNQILWKLHFYNTVTVISLYRKGGDKFRSSKMSLHFAASIKTECVSISPLQKNKY